jgi:hypothetical protein
MIDDFMFLIAIVDSLLKAPDPDELILMVNPMAAKQYVYDLAHTLLLRSLC